MLLVNILLSISTFLTFLLGLFIIVSNTKKMLNRAFFSLLMSAFIWLGANLMANLMSDPYEALIFARATLIGAVLLPYSFLLFAKIYTDEKHFKIGSIVWWGLPPLLIALASPTKLNIESVGSYGRNTITGPIYYLLIPLLATYFGWGLLLFVKTYRKTKNLDEKARLKYIFSGIVLTLIPAVIMGVILPIVGHSQSYLYGPNTITIFAVFTFIAIVRHRLLDIRLLVARSLAYFMLFFTIISVYSLTVFVLATHIFGANKFSQQVVPLMAAIFSGFTLRPLGNFFDRVTNRFFYRDAYDTQVFLDQFNKLLVSTFEFTPLLRKSADIIEENLKPSYVVFGIKETEAAPQRIIGTPGHPVFDEQQIKFVRSRTPKIGRRLIVTDLLEEKHSDLQHVLQDADVSVIARLASKLNGEGLGYLLLGPKKSGNLYSSQDLKVIEIISNELVIAIQNSLRFEEIQNFNETLQARVNEATRRVRAANEKLKVLDETKDDFISMASHQLRTPLTSIKGYISMVLEGDAGKLNKQQEQMLGQAFFSSQRMVYLIADLLNLSRLKTGKFLIEQSPVNLSDIVEQELQQLKETAASRGHVLDFVKPKDFPTLMLDETKIRQVIMNFTDNAIYYTPNGGHIVVRLIDNPSSVELRVEDNGIGVPKHEQPHLFTKFYRAGNARKARPDGTGLGLFMAKKVIVALGGSLIFDTEEGKGSTFGFSFAKDKLAVPAHIPVIKPTIPAK